MNGHLPAVEDPILPIIKEVTPVPLPAPVPAASGTSGGNDQEATAAVNRSISSSSSSSREQESGGGAIVMHEKRSVNQGSLHGGTPEPEPEPDPEPEPKPETEKALDEPGPAIIPPPPAGAQTQAEAVLETPLLPTTTTAAPTATSTASPHPAPFQYINSPRPLLSRESRDRRCNQDGRAPSPTPNDSHHSKMIFSDLYKSPRSPLSKLRHPHLQHHSSSEQAPDFDADLLSKDKAKQKEAVKRFLAQKIRTDWDFQWPAHGNPPGLPSTEEPVVAEPASIADKDIEGFLEVAIEREDEDITPVADEDAVVDSGEEADSETDSVYSSVSEDTVHYRPRAEWTSDLSDDEHIVSPSSPFRFDNPDSIGAAVRASSMARKAKRRREVRHEIKWNQGLACFEARRDAWTGARTVHVKPKPPSPESPSSPRRGLFWRTHSNTNRSIMSSGSQAVASPLSPVTTAQSHHSTHSGQAELSSIPTTSMDDSSSHAHDLSPKTSNSDSASQQHPVETLLPIAPPLLPPANPMRASITPALYISIYDKVVVHSLQPSCPINLKDMIRACVTGWKRDGEWPPRPTELPAVIAVRKKKEKRDSITSPTSARRMSFGFLNRGDKDEKEKAGEKLGEGRRESVAEDGSTGKAFRRSIQKVLGIGHGHANAPPVANGNGHGKEGGGAA